MSYLLPTIALQVGSGTEAAPDPDVLEFSLRSAEYGEASDPAVTATSPKPILKSRSF